MGLKPNDIVTDLDPDSMFYEKQGLLIKIQLRFWGKPEVIVRFDRKYDIYSRFEADKDEEWVYVFHDLRFLRMDPDWNPDVYPNRFFPDRWHSVYMLNFPIDLFEPCMVEDCPSLQERTAWFNVWGSVCNAHLCAHHARIYHGMCGDSFPWRPEAA